MKNKDFTYKVNDWCIIGIITIFLYLVCTSCATSKMPYEQAKKEWYCPPKKKYKPNKPNNENSFIHHPGSNN